MDRAEIRLRLGGRRESQAAGADRENRVGRQEPKTLISARHGWPYHRKKIGEHGARHFFATIDSRGVSCRSN